MEQELVKIAVLTKQGKRRVEAHPSSTPGLYIHPALFEKMSEPDDHDIWTVTHQRSGLQVVGRILGKPLAFAVCDFLGSHADWIGGKAAIKKNKGADRAVSKVLREVKRLLEAYEHCFAELEIKKDPESNAESG